MINQRERIGVLATKLSDYRSITRPTEYRLIKDANRFKPGDIRPYPALDTEFLFGGIRGRSPVFLARHTRAGMAVMRERAF